jgi:hypothetical protein
LDATPIERISIINTIQCLFETSKLSPHTGQDEKDIGVPLTIVVLTMGEVIPDLHFLHFIYIHTNEG